MSRWVTRCDRSSGSQLPEAAGTHPNVAIRSAMELVISVDGLRCIPLMAVGDRFVVNAYEGEEELWCAESDDEVAKEGPMREKSSRWRREALRATLAVAASSLLLAGCSTSRAGPAPNLPSASPFSPADLLLVLPLVVHGHELTAKTAPPVDTLTGEPWQANASVPNRAWLDDPRLNGRVSLVGESQSRWHRFRPPSGRRGAGNRVVSRRYHRRGRGSDRRTSLCAR